MSTAEILGKSLIIENRGVHVLTWDDKGELVRCLVILLSVLREKRIMPLIISSEKSEKYLWEILTQKHHFESDDVSKTEDRDFLLFLFIQQAVNKTIGPILNGWRKELSEKPGTLLIIRDADFIGFQRNAPDLSSYIGPKIFDTSNMLSIWNNETNEQIDLNLPVNIEQIIKSLPGSLPKKEELEKWLAEHPSID